MNKNTIIAQTKKWIVDVVIGCNFCPFAAREVKRESIFFEVLEGDKKATVLTTLLQLIKKMDVEEGIETAFLILPKGHDHFAVFLKLIHAAEMLLKKEGYEGVYQLATFHPLYFFAGSRMSDAANYTNRSPYPMLQVLRESSVSRAVENYPDTHIIPQNNIDFARAKGLAYMQTLRAACLEIIV